MKKYLSILFLLLTVSAFALPVDSVTNYVAGLATNQNFWTGVNSFTTISNNAGSGSVILMGSEAIKDANGVPALSWYQGFGGRSLLDTSDNPSVYWNTRQLYLSDGLTPTLDWQNLLLLGNWTATNVTATGSFAGTHSGNGGGLTNQPANTFYSDTNALYFANLAGIADLGVRNDLIGFVNELRQGGLWSKFVDCSLLYPRFNPSAGYTFMGRPMTVTGSVGKWGLACRSGSGQVIVTVPDMRTNTQVYVWHTIPVNVSGNLPMAYLGGLANTNQLQSLYFCAGESCTVLGFRIRAGGIENGSSGNNAQPSWLIKNTIFGFNYIYFSQDMYSGNKEVTGFSYDGSSLSGWHRYRQVKLDYNNPTFSTNYALAGLQITAPLTNWWIGKDFLTTNITTTASADVEIGLLLNAPITNLNDWKTVYRALRWLDPDNKDLRVVGDSREDVTEGYAAGVPGSVTNYAFAKIKAANEANTNAINILNDSLGGDAIGHYSPLAVNDAAYTNYTGPFENGFVPSGKVMSDDVVFIEGINDAFGTFGSFLNSNILAVAQMARTNNVALHMATIFQTATNGGVYPQNGYASNEANRENANSFIHSNMTIFASIVPFDEYISPAMMNTNNGISYDGTHQLGTNAPPILQEEANLIMGDPLPLGATTNQYLNYQGNFTGNGSGLTNLNAASIVHKIIQTNWISGAVYNNSYGTAITVSGKGVQTMTGVAGATDLALRCDALPANGGWTNDLATGTLITSLATSVTNYISIEVPTNANWTFTNVSTGAGDSATVIGGQIKY